MTFKIFMGCLVLGSNIGFMKFRVTYLRQK